MATFIFAAIATVLPSIMAFYIRHLIKKLEVEKSNVDVLTRKVASWEDFGRKAIAYADSQKKNSERVDAGVSDDDASAMLSQNR